MADWGAHTPRHSHVDADDTGVLWAIEMGHYKQSDVIVVLAISASIHVAVLREKCAAVPEFQLRVRVRYYDINSRTIEPQQSVLC